MGRKQVVLFQAQNDNPAEFRVNVHFQLIAFKLERLAYDNALFSACRLTDKSVEWELGQANVQVPASAIVTFIHTAVLDPVFVIESKDLGRWLNAVLVETTGRAARYQRLAPLVLFLLRIVHLDLVRNRFPGGWMVDQIVILCSSRQ